MSVEMSSYASTSTISSPAVSPYPPATPSSLNSRKRSKLSTKAKSEVFLASASLATIPSMLSLSVNPDISIVYLSTIQHDERQICPTKNDTLCNLKSYQELTGSLNHLSVFTRP